MNIANPRCRRWSMVLTLAAIVSLAAPAWSADGPLPDQARTAMQRATAFMRSISTEGGYLWRYSPDLRERARSRRSGE